MTTDASPFALSMPTPQVRERPAAVLPGLPMLGVAVLLTAAGGYPIYLLTEGAAPTWPIVSSTLLFLAAGLLYAGLTVVAPREARVIQFLGAYVGTVRDAGLQWVNPFTTRHKITTRIRNHETTVSKVNDADGNPIEIAAVVVWQVEDTARAVFEVDDFVQFVTVQAETAVRQIATTYPYDASVAGQISLRDSADEITERLSQEVAARVASAGVRIVESRITHLAYAKEIAQAMLQRQQAGAVIAARQLIVEGAVGMVEMALERLQARGVVELDDERRAAMVSNLLVVLCGTQATQPVVNAGSLYS
jgi:regulator of protease activity HflC (stomatin/prohibitin superfamily)